MDWRWNGAGCTCDKTRVLKRQHQNLGDGSLQRCHLAGERGQVLPRSSPGYIGCLRLAMVGMSTPQKSANHTNQSCLNFSSREPAYKHTTRQLCGLFTANFFQLFCMFETVHNKILAKQYDSMCLKKTDVKNSFQTFASEQDSVGRGKAFLALQQLGEKKTHHKNSVENHRGKEGQKNENPREKEYMQSELRLLVAFFTEAG